jgi:hypothetical protein
VRKSWPNLIITFLSFLVFVFFFPHLTGDIGHTYCGYHINSGTSPASMRSIRLRAGHGLLSLYIVIVHFDASADTVKLLAGDDAHEGYSFRVTTYPAESPAGLHWYQKIGFNFEHHTHTSPPNGFSETIVSVPLLLPLILSTLFPIRWYIALRRNAKHPALGCPKCHYDLRATDIGRCPECGTPFDKQSLQNKDTYVLYTFPLPESAGKLPPDCLNQICKDCFIEAAKAHPLLRPQYPFLIIILALVGIATALGLLLPDLLTWITVLIVLPSLYLAIRLYKSYLTRMLTPRLAAAIDAELAKQPAADSSSPTSPQPPQTKKVQ